VWNALFFLTPPAERPFLSLLLFTGAWHIWGGCGKVGGERERIASGDRRFRRRRRSGGGWGGEVMMEMMVVEVVEEEEYPSTVRMRGDRRRSRGASTT